MKDDSTSGLTPASSTATDEQLLKNYLHGNRSALDTILRRHQDRLARIAYRITGCDHEAEDVRHTIFVRLLQLMEQGQTPDCVGGWLTRCTVNEAVTRMRRRNREGRLLANHAQASFTAADDAPTQCLQNRESRDQLSIALEQLSADDRALLSLRFDDGLTFREIGDALDRPISTVKSQLSRAISRLRDSYGLNQ